jgi:DNA-binding protein H-NS
MKNGDLEKMTVDQLWELHELVVAKLTERIAAEKAQLEERLRKLGSAVTNHVRPERRAYPKVQPKYRNPSKRGETWAGRGKQPRWLTAQLRSGKELADFLI